MSVQTIYDKFTRFIKTYKKYFKTYEEKWNDKYNEVVRFIDKHKRVPSRFTTNKHEKSLNKWIIHQNENYKSRINTMKNNQIYNKYSKFKIKYKDYFKNENN